MVRRILSFVLLAGSLTINTAAQAGPADEPVKDASVRNAAGEHEQNAQAAAAEALLKEWRATVFFKEGIHAVHSGIISAFQTVLQPGESEKRALILTDSEAALQAARAIIAEVQGDASLQAILMRHFTAKKLSLPGHVLLSECSRGICRSVYAMTADEWKKAKASVRYGSFSESFNAFRSAPFADSALLRELGLPELALLNSMRRTSALYANVRSSIVPVASVMKKALLFEEKRDEGVRSLMKAGAMQDLTLQSIFAAESPKSFAEELEQAGIPFLAWHPETPVLRQVARVQGFACFDGSAKSELPASMGFIKQCFAEGRGLNLVIELLESAAERAPATPEVWEYLASAYLAADRPAPAQIAARVWFVTAKDPKEAGLWLLKKFSSDARSRELLAFLEDATVHTDSR